MILALIQPQKHWFLRISNLLHSSKPFLRPVTSSDERPSLVADRRLKEGAKGAWAGQRKDSPKKIMKIGKIRCPIHEDLWIRKDIHTFRGLLRNYSDEICTMASHIIPFERRSLFSNRWNFLGASRQRGQKYGRNEPWDVVLRYDTHFPSFSIQFR